MRFMHKALTALGAMMMFLALSSPAARADERNQLSYLTFSQPIQVPMPSGKVIVLQAGTYAFRINTGESNYNEVRIYDKLQKHLFAQVKTNASTFLAPTTAYLTDHTLLTFAQGRPGQPLTLVKWFYMDSNWGHNFVFSPRIENQISEEKTFTVIAKSTPINLSSPKGEVEASNLH